MTAKAKKAKKKVAKRAHKKYFKKHSVSDSYRPPKKKPPTKSGN